jgi:hypothetical protein
VFEKKLLADAVVVEDEGSGGRTLHIDSHGVSWERRTYLLEVRPAGAERFRVRSTSKVAAFYAPMRGDHVKVSYNPASHKTEIQIEGDSRYDPKLIRARHKQERAARKAQEPPS